MSPLGEYQDRRDLKQIDCSKTVWILATNALDSTIQNFCKLHHKSIFEDDDVSEKLRLMKSLSKAIKEDFLAKFGVSLKLKFGNHWDFCANRKSGLMVDTLVSSHRSNLGLPSISAIFPW
jgi:hypothetical protein